MNPKPKYKELEERVKTLEKELDRVRGEGFVSGDEDRYRKLFELESDALFLIDSTDGGILEANRAASEMYGYSRDELLELCNTDLSAEPESTRRATREEHPVVPVRYHRKKDGTVFPVEITGSHFEWEGRRVHIAAIREIGWRLRAEEKLRQSEQRLRNVLETVGMIAVSLDTQGRVTFCNDFFLDLTGWKREEVLGKNWFESFLPDDSREVLENVFRKTVESGEVKAYYQNAVLRKDGGQRIIAWRDTLFRDSRGDVIGMTSLGEDVTEMRNFEAERAEYEKVFTSTLEAVDSMLVVIDEDHRIVLCNWKDHEWVPEEDRDKRPFCYEVMKDLAAPCSYCPPVKTFKDGKIRWYEAQNPLDGSYKEISVIPIFDETGKRVQYVLENVRDITERKRSEEALKSSHQTLLTVLDSIDATIYVADMDTHEVLFMNKHMIESFGRDMTGETCWKVFRGEPAPCPNCTNDQLLDEEGKATGARVWQGRNPITGKWYINCDRAIEWTDGHMVRIQIATDVTDLIRMEEELRQAQKMEAVGTLAGGIAHNFNNTLMGIQGRASLMLMDKSPSHPDWAHLKGIEEYVRSAAELTKDLLGFAKGGKYEVKPTDLNELIRHESRMFGQTKKEIRIREKLQEDLRPAEVDQGQIRQALLNLFVNAWQAMPAGGDLYVQSENVILDEEGVKPPEIPPGRYVRISVTDTGVGMDPSTAEKIFEPFFTTQAMGRGTGLGLASVYGIVKNHGGFIHVQSEMGQGTTFHIYLPASGKELSREEEPDAQVVRGVGTLLLVDDEEMIIEVGGQLLERLGYRVLTARSGREAVDLFAKQGDEIDLVVLDMIMPGMGGGETYERIKEIHPDVKVLLSSGYSIDGQAQEILDRGCRGFIQKPFNLEDLSRKVKDALDA